LKEKLLNASEVSLFKFILVCIGIIIGSVGQQVCLPLFLGSFGGSTGQYFVILWCSVLFNVFFWPIVFHRMKTGVITSEMRKYKKHWKLILIGIFDALNGILIVFSSSLGRTPGALQAILGQTIIPFTIIFSKLILRKTYKFDQILGAILTILGVLVSLIPIFNDFSVGPVKIYWPIIFLCGMIPAVLMNIFEEDVFHDIPKYDNIYLLAWESLYQVLTVLLLFWADIIPGFGTSDNLDMWSPRIKDGLICFWNPWNAESNKCDYCFLTGILFTFAYCFSYIYGASMMKMASANTTAIISAISPAFVIFFWIIFTGLNRWAGGSDYTKLDIICYIISLLIIIVGVIIYRRAERKQMDDQLQAFKDGEEPFFKRM